MIEISLVKGLSRCVVRLACKVERQKRKEPKVQPCLDPSSLMMIVGGEVCGTKFRTGRA